MAETTKPDLKQVTIYTGGFCPNPPGRGGWGVVLIYGQHRKELCGGFRQTTIKRMELMAAVQGLHALKTKCQVVLYSSSRYLVASMMKGRVRQWAANGWKRKIRGVRNVDLWQQLLELSDQHRVQFMWAKEQAGNRENERAGQLSVQAAEGRDLGVDKNYEENWLAGRNLLFDAEAGEEASKKRVPCEEPAALSRLLSQPDFPATAPAGRLCLQSVGPVTDLQQAILECVRSFPGQLSRTTVARILVASCSRRIDNYRHHALYGVFQHLSRTEVSQHVDELIVAGFISQQGRGLWPAKQDQPEA